jgi:hypothetical protein
MINIEANLESTIYLRVDENESKVLDDHRVLVVGGVFMIFEAVKGICQVIIDYVKDLNCYRVN